MRILLANDGSSGAEQALILADGMRSPSGSTLRIVGVVEQSAVQFSSPMAGPSMVATREVDSQIAEFEEDRLGDIVRRLERSGRSVESIFLRGRPATALVEEAIHFRADLVIVGSRGHGPIASLVLGSVSAEVVDHAPCPVLVARSPGITRILFATDGSGPSAAAGAILAAWPIFDGVPIHVVSVADVVQAWHTGIAPTMYVEVMEAYSRDLKEARSAHRRIADTAASQLREAGRESDATVRVGDAAGEIVAAIDDLATDLVVIGSRGRTGLTRMVLGSVARNVLHGSKASVLVVHEGKTSPSPQS